MEEKKDQQVCRKLLDYDDTIKFQLMHLLINANTDILYPRIQQMGQGQQVVPLAEQQVGGNANQENNGNQENHEENGQVVQRREADSPLIMLLKNNNWLLFGKILYGIELQFQTKLDRLFSEIKNQTLRAALSTASLALFSATGIGGSRGYNTCDFRYFLNNNPDDDLIESRKLNTKLVPELKKCYDSASELKSDNNYILYKELNFYLPRLENARNLYNQEEVINLFNVKFEDRTFEDTINDYLSCYQATKNTLKIIHQQNQIQNGLAPVVRGQAEPEVAPPAEQQVGDNANQENNGNLQNQGDDGNDNQPHNPNQPQQPNNQGVALNNNDENALQVRVGNRNVVLNQLERPEVRRGDNENPAREIELAPINPQNNQDDLQNEPNHPERPRVRRGDDENPAMSPLRNILPANPQNQADNNHERENLLAELKRAFDEEQAAQEARGKREEDETNRRGCCRRR